MFEEMSDSADDFCLRWNDHHKLIWGTMERLLTSQTMTDVTLSLVNGHRYKAHRLVLSACSPYFEDLFSNHDPSVLAVVYLKGINPFHMQLLLQYMYRGEVNVEESEILSLLESAKDLQIRGLTEAAENITHRTKIKEEVKDYEVVDDDLKTNSEEIMEEINEQEREEPTSPPSNPTPSTKMSSSSSKNVVKKNIASPGGSETICLECGKRFTHRWMLERHSTTHSGIQRFVCSICERRFSHQASAARHIKNVHKEKNTCYLINKLEGNSFPTKLDEVYQHE